MELSTWRIPRERPRVRVEMQSERIMSSRVRASGGAWRWFVLPCVPDRVRRLRNAVNRFHSARLSFEDYFSISGGSVPIRRAVADGREGRSTPYVVDHHECDEHFARP